MMVHCILLVERLGSAGREWTFHFDTLLRLGCNPLFFLNHRQVVQHRQSRPPSTIHRRHMAEHRMTHRGDPRLP